MRGHSSILYCSACREVRSVVQCPAMPNDEKERQAAVDQLHLTDVDIEVAFDRLAKLLAMLLEMPISVFTVIDGDRAFFRSVIGLSLRESPRQLSFCAHCILQHDLFIVEDARLDPRFRDNPNVTGLPNLVFYAGTPVHAPNGQPIGTLCVFDHRPRALTRTMENTMVTLTAILEDELRMRVLSTVDYLTGLFNRRQYDDAIGREWNRTRRMGLPLSLFSIDIDHFKAFNDHYGHLAGDACLRTISHALQKECARSGDQAFRVGGEEFAVILPGTGLPGARILATRLKQALHRLAIPHERAPKQEVTFSIGIAAVTSPAGHQLVEFLQAADDALYGAKKQGRDCMVAKPL
ncbi:MAG: diguanylate cyclase [Halomonadaceae bacterium]|nr:MAG: diguanylate cyclase [Halomonadaceae bacterium]